MKNLQELSNLHDKHQEENKAVLNKMQDISQKNGQKIKNYTSQLETNAKVQKKSRDDFLEDREKTLKGRYHSTQPWKSRRTQNSKNSNSSSTSTKANIT